MAPPFQKGNHFTRLRLSTSSLCKKWGDHLKTFFSATDEDIASGKTTDIYFSRTMEILKAKGMLERHALAEVTVAKLPRDWTWATYCGLEEALRMMEGKKVDIWGLPEGTLFRSRTQSGVKVPVLNIEGAYSEYCIMETPMLGFICHSTGVATMASRCRYAAGDRSMVAFGIRRMHPSIAPMLDRSSYIGGCDGVSSLIGAELIGNKPEGTMPHSLIVMFGSSIEAFKAFDEVIDPLVPRIALIDTYSDEKTEAINAAEEIKDLFGVRLDTPVSRRGSFPELVREVRWELDIRGYKNVKIILSGGLDDRTIPELVRCGADGFGVGTSISNAPTVDFALDIVERDGQPVAKRGKFGGRKYLYKCPECLTFEVTTSPEEVPCCQNCKAEMRRADKKLIEHGRRVEEKLSPAELRNRVLRQIKQITEL